MKLKKLEKQTKAKTKKKNVYAEKTKKIKKKRKPTKK